MEKVGFLTPISFGDQPKSFSQSLLETVDSYFYLGGKKAYVIPGYALQNSEGACLTEDSPALLLTALKVVSYLTVILPAIMLAVKAILRAIYAFHIIDAKQKLEEGVNLSQDTFAKIHALMPKILKLENDEEITWYPSDHNLVFSLKSVPNLIFKMGKPNTGRMIGRRRFYAKELIDHRFDNMVKAKEVCLAHQLGQLVIPHAKKFIVDDMNLLAEERLDFHQDDSIQEQLYQTLGGLNTTIKQLATFTAKTGFSDVEWRNMPILDDAPEFQGPRRVALIDLEEMEGADTGIFGAPWRRGLIRCLASEEQIDLALAEAQRHGIVNDFITPEQIKARRIKEIQDDQQLQQFYANNGVSTNARKPIRVDDLKTLDLNLDEQGCRTILETHQNGPDEEPVIKSRKQTITLRDAVIDVIGQINNAITETPENASIKAKRYILLGLSNNDNLIYYNRIGLPNGKRIVENDEEEQLIWLRRIINALVAKKYLFKLDKVNGHGYFIQA